MGVAILKAKRSTTLLTVKMFKFSIDRGGTFTDVYAECPDGSTRVMKLLSEDPDNYPDAPREAIRRIMQEVGKSPTAGISELHPQCFNSTISS